MKRSEDGIRDKNQDWIYKEFWGWKRRAENAESKLFEADNPNDYFKNELPRERERKET